MATQRSRLLDTANKVVPITLACQLVGISVTSGKSYCPQQVYHSGSLAKSFRVYPDTNSGWCFGPCGYFTPVSIYTAVFGGDAEHAAQVLLDAAGHRMAETLTFWESRPEPVPDQSALARALRLWAERTLPGWELAQFDVEPAARLGACLQLLPLVNTPSDAEHWLSAAKSALSRLHSGRKEYV